MHDVLRFQKQIDNVGVELHLTSSGFIEQVFHQMRGFLQNAEAKGSCPSFDRVGSPKDGIQLFGIWRFRLQNQQMLLHISQQFVRFIKKCLIKIAYIHAHAVTSVRLMALREH